MIFGILDCKQPVIAKVNGAAARSRCTEFGTVAVSRIKSNLTKDHAEGIAALKEKRTPRFTGE